MKKLFTLTAICMFLSHMNFAQSYKDGFSNDVGAPTAPYWGTGGTGYTIAHVAGSGTTTITGNGTSGTYHSVSYDPYDNPQMSGSGTAIPSVNMSGTDQDTIFVIAKSSVAGTKLRIDIKDVNDYVSNAGTINNEVTLTTSYALYKLVYTTPQDGAYGGTGCASGPCTVDKASIKEFLVYADAVNGGFNGVLTIDYFQVGGNSSTAVVAGVQAAQDIIASKMYPNPSAGQTTVEFSLKSVSDVKVIVTDLLGKQVASIQETTSDFSETFDTSNLPKGIYSVNYYINNQPAKAELLVVK
jgi:hypothetical protein